MNTNHLMHPRVANNYADKGYFPTDEISLDGICARLDISGEKIRIFDPCCGGGDALASVAQALSNAGCICESYGIELDHLRAAAASTKLSFAIQGDIESCITQAKQVGLLFLNPPYGYAAADHLSNARTKRLEEIFFSTTVPTLQEKGILVLIVPTTALTETFTQEIASRFIEVRMFKAGVDTYKQMVIFGIKPKTRASISKAVLKQQQAMLMKPENAPALTEPVDFWYEIPPATTGVFRPINHRPDAVGLAVELSTLHNQTLWPHIGEWFGSGLALTKRRPLCPLGPWHTALALAAGQVNGIVQSGDGRKLLVKGSTYKIKVSTIEEQEKSDGQIDIVTTQIDRFVPSIRAIDLTVGSVGFGEVLTIK